MNPVIDSYVFTAMEHELERYHDLLPFMSAHETFHVLQHERMKAGRFNTSAMTNYSVKILNKTAERAIYHFTRIDELEKEEKSIRGHVAAIKLLGLLNHTATRIYELASREEEYQCDEFALKVYPQTKIERFAEFLEDMDFISQKAGSHLKDHPSNENRIERLFTIKSSL